MQFVHESTSNAVSLMFISYLLFCSVLKYLFMKSDKEWSGVENPMDYQSSTSDAARSSAGLLVSMEFDIEPSLSSI